MRIRIDDPAALPALRRYLAARTDFIVGEGEAGTLAVGVLGSLREGGHTELVRYLRPWQDRNLDVMVNIVPDS
jgi:hypothetical protein